MSTLKKQTRKSNVKKFKTKKKWSSYASDTFIKNSKTYMKLEEDEKEDGKIEYMYHQKLVRKFMGPETPYRGLLLYHGLGSGKTCSSVLISEANRSLRKTVVFLPNSLEANFKIEIQKCSDYDVLQKPSNDWYKIELNSSNKKLVQTFFNKFVLSKFDTLNIQKYIWLNLSNDEPILEKLKGYEKKSFKSLSQKEKEDILEQNRKIKLAQYQIEHYDGISRNRIKEIEKNHELDNSLVIIDEAHNLGSMMRNQKFTETQEKGSIRGRLIYELFMKAKNTRFIFLTGTPITSNPMELAYIYNVLRGPIDIFRIPIDYTNKNYDLDRIKRIVNDYKYFDFMKIFKTYIEVTKVPTNFCRTDDGYLKFEANTPSNHSEWLIDLKEYFHKNKVEIDINDIITYKNNCFDVPTYENMNDDSFMSAFSGENNSDVFMRRIVGLTSFYGGSEKDKKHFPEVIYHPIDKVPMSIIQYTQYQDERKKEINREKKNKMRKKDDDLVETFKARTRLLSNFVFPIELYSQISEKSDENVSKLSKSKNKQDDLEEANEVEDETMNHDIITAFNNYIDKNSKNKGFYDTIYELSPKYNLIESRISKNTGTSVVYSNFKNKSGLYAFSCILKYLGWNMITLHLVNKKTDEWEIKESNKNSSGKSFAIYDSTDSEGRSQEILRKIFNNQLNDIPKSILEQLSGNSNLYGELIKTLLITPKGAEGITLKNVRQLHVVEHYWSYVRTEQVIGRAVRYKSHEELKNPEERKVDIFKYVTVFDDKLSKFLLKNPEYSADFTTIKDFDDSKTSDEFVLAISEKKFKIINSFLNMVKRSSIDCELNYKTKCITQDLLKDDFHPNFQEHLKISNSNTNDKNIINTDLDIKNLKRKNWLPLPMQGRTVFINPETNDLYDYESIISQKPILLGRLFEDQKRFVRAPN